MPLVSCEGCNVRVKRSGLYPHLRLSQNLKCKEYLDRLTYDHVQTFESDNDNENDEGPWPPRFADADDLAIDPGGDFFGDYNDYTAEEFGMEIDEEEPNATKAKVEGEEEIEDEIEGEEELDDADDAVFEATLAEEENGLEPERKKKPERPIESKPT